MTYVVTPEMRGAADHFITEARAAAPPSASFVPRPVTIRCAFCPYQITAEAPDAILAGRAHRDEVHGEQIAAAAAERAAAARAADAAAHEDHMQRRLQRPGSPDEPVRAATHGTQRAAERCKRANGEPCEVCRPFYEARLVTKRGIAQRAKDAAMA